MARLRYTTVVDPPSFVSVTLAVQVLFEHPEGREQGEPWSPLSHPNVNSVVFASDGRHGAVCGPCTAEPAPGGALRRLGLGVEGR